MWEHTVVLLATLFGGGAVVSASCPCRSPLPTEYTSELCCDRYSSSRRQVFELQTSPETYPNDSVFAESPEVHWQTSITQDEPWGETFPTSDRAASSTSYPSWPAHESEPLVVPRHTPRRRHVLDEDQKQTLESLLLFIEDLQKFPNATSTRRPRQAASPPDCGPQRRYRAADGSCNSAEKPLRGAAGQGTTRLVLPPSYQDGVFLPRFLDSSGRPLPGARHVSLAVTSSRDVPLPQFTDSVMQWGQFLDHDLALTPEVEPPTPCCKLGRRAEDAHAFCLPIPALPTDPVYSRCRKTCIEFARSIPTWHERQQVITQLNTRTSYIDADMLYGVTDKWTHSLREHRAGRLRVGPGKLLLPDPEPELRCFSTNEREPCFRSGDTRVNEQVRLAVMHIVWMREHNRIAGRLQELNPHWEDERIFQESRRIVIAELQHITYSGWLPIVLGSNYTDANMMGDQQGHTTYSNRYNAETEPTVATEFSSAAFRFGHSLINNHVFLFSDVRQPPFGFTRLRDIFFSPHLIYQGALDFLARSLVAQAPQKCDLEFAGALTGHLFQERGTLCGMDLVAMNIQRGRDHGVPTYSSARRWCGLPRLATWAALTRVMSPEAVVRLAGVYRTVEDIDLYIGGVAERPIDGGLVGPTFQCLIGNQFFRLRWGDNFFYDLGGDQRPWRFTLQQLEQLAHSTWARVLCDAVPAMGIIQPDAFRAESEANRRISCSQLPEVNLDPWRETEDQVPVEREPTADELEAIKGLVAGLDAALLNGGGLDGGLLDGGLTAEALA